MTAKGNYAEGSITRHIYRLALPTLLAELVNVLYSIVDRMYIGYMPLDGTLALSGVGVVFPLISFISAFSSLISSGAAPIAAIERGKGRDDSATLIMETAFTFTLLISLVLTVSLFAFRTPLLYWMGADESTIGYASDYFSIYVIGSVFVLISVGFNSFITMQGFGTTGMMTVVIGAVLNTVLDPLFIYVFSLGVKGAAIATVISQAVSSIWVILFLKGKKSTLKLERLICDWGIIKRILKLGVSGFMFKMTNSLTQAASNMTIRSFGGELSTLYIGAMSIINSTREMVSLPIQSITSSSQPVMGYNYGAGKSDRVCKTIRVMTLSSFSYALLAWAFVMAFPGLLISIFTPDRTLLSLTVPSMRIYFAVFFMMSLQSSGQTTFVGLNHPRSAVFFSLLRKVFLVFPLILILPRIGMGVDGVFYAEAISQLVGASCCYMTMYFTIYRPMKKDNTITKERLIMERQDKDLAFMLQYENVAWYDNGEIRVLDRRVYPQKTEFVICRTVEDVRSAIHDMVTQSTGPYTLAPMGMALAAKEAEGKTPLEAEKYLKEASLTISSARPTTQKRMFSLTEKCIPVALKAMAEGKKADYAVRDFVVEMNNERYARVDRIAHNLVDKFPQGGTVMTQCYAETILGLMLRECRRRGNPIRLFCPETRPFFQGARFTSTVCSQMGFDTTLITDNMPAFVMKNEHVDVFTCAADAISVDGYVFNKVGTSQIAICAKYFGVPVYVTGAPDIGHPTYDTVTIEMRDPDETLRAMGVRTAAEGVKGYYPAFDMTPPELITGIVTNKGIFNPHSLKEYFADGLEAELTV